MPPQAPPNDLTRLLNPGAASSPAQPPGDGVVQYIGGLDPTAVASPQPSLAPTTPTTPAAAPPTPVGEPRTKGSSQYEVRRRELLKVAEEMRNDLKAVEQAVQALNRQVQEVGAWDVAQQLSAKVNTANTNMLDGLELFVKGYQAAAGRVEQAAKTYGKAEHGAKTAAENSTIKNATPW
jgi:hypothetical protein